MLRYSLALPEAAAAIEAAVEAVLDEGFRTSGIGASASAARMVATSETGRLIAERIGPVRISEPAAA